MVSIANAGSQQAVHLQHATRNVFAELFATRDLAGRDLEVTIESVKLLQICLLATLGRMDACAFASSLQLIQWH